MYEICTYRKRVEDKGLVSFSVKMQESDLFIRAEESLNSQARECLLSLRRLIQDYIQEYPQFAASLEPYPVEAQAADIVREMAAASTLAGVGPMAAVAGAIAEYVGRELLRHSAQVIVENGGDIFMKTNETRKIGIFAGESCYSARLALEIAPGRSWGVCTSSHTVGHSLSLGQADAAVVISHSAILADAWATRLGNMVKSAADVETTLNFIKAQPGIKGAVIIIGEKIGAWGEVKLVKVKP